MTISTDMDAREVLAGQLVDGLTWSDARDEARRARQRSSTPAGRPALGIAIYQQVELHRPRGRLAEAAEAYRSASRRGHPPQLWLVSAMSRSRPTA